VRACRGLHGIRCDVEGAEPVLLEEECTHGSTLAERRARDIGAAADPNP
jgi:hypothetical protein